MPEWRLGSGRTPRVGIVGGTGAVGIEVVEILRERAFPMESLRLFASPRSAGRVVDVGGTSFTVEAAASADFGDLDLAFFSAGKEQAREMAPSAVEAGCVVIDNSSAFRNEADVPLVVPEVNGSELTRHEGLVANPNCSTIIGVMVAGPLSRAFGLDRMVVATYQAASGAGARGLDELERGTREDLAGAGSPADVFPEGLAFNVIPRIGDAAEDGVTDEERKMLTESRRILGLTGLRVTTTCVRVPVRRCHSLAVTYELGRAVTVAEVERVLAAAPGVEVDPVPCPTRWSGRDAVAAGRLRVDPEVPEVLSAFVVGDQVRKGAALNAVQIAEALVGAGPPA